MAIVAQLVREIGGEAAEVVSLLEPGRRLSELSRTGPVEARLMTADVIVCLGAGAEPALAETLERARQAGLPVCALVDSLPRDLLFPGPNEKGIDPQVWMDPNLWRQTVDVLVPVVAGAAPEFASEIETRGHTARFRLRKLTDDIRTLGGLIPPERRKLRTLNAGLRYLGRAAGVAVEIGEPTFSTLESEKLERLALDTLQAPGDKLVARAEAHDLSLYEGLVRYAMDLMLISRR